MNKKIISALIITAMLAGLTACGSEPEETVEDISSMETTVSETENEGISALMTPAAETTIAEETTAAEEITTTTEAITTVKITTTTVETTTTAAETTTTAVEVTEPVGGSTRDIWVSKVSNFIRTKLVNDENIGGACFCFPPSAYTAQVRLDDYTFDGVPEIITTQGGEDGYCSNKIFSIDGKLLYSYLGGYDYDNNDFKEEKYSVCINGETNEKVLMISTYNDYWGYRNESMFCFQDCISCCESYDWDGSFSVYIEEFSPADGYDYFIESAETESEAAKLKEKYFGKYTEQSEFSLSGAKWRITKDDIDYSDKELGNSEAEKLVDAYMSFAGIE